MGDVAVTSKACERAMLTGNPAPTGQLGRFVRGGGTPNQRLMAVGAIANAFRDPLLDRALVVADEMLFQEERQGPWPWEMLAPTPHDEMYGLGHIALVAAGIRFGGARAELGRRAAKILGQALRLADLGATPQGDNIYLPGVRAPHGANMSRRGMVIFRTEVRRREGFPVEHRGTGGRPRPLKYDDDADPLVEGPAYWARLLLDGPGGEALVEPWSSKADLPARMRLPLTVERWEGGTLAWMDDPGEAARAPFIIQGSAAAKRERGGDGDEDPTDWIMALHGPVGHHSVSAGSSWTTPRPKAPAGAKRTFIPGV